MTEPSDSIAKARERTRGTAFTVLLDEYREIRREMEADEPGREVLTEALLKEIFQEAWRHQFDEDRTEFQRRVKDVVEDAVRLHYLGEEDER